MDDYMDRDQESSSTLGTVLAQDHHARPWLALGGPIDWDQVWETNGETM
jgi:uncharacterized lipoprotein